MGFYKLQGKQHSAGTFGTYDDALAAAETAEEAARAAQPAVVPATGHTVATYMPVFIAGHYVRDTSRDTYGNHAKVVVRHIGGVALHDLTPAVIRTFARTLESSGMSMSTAQKVMSVAKLMCDMAVIDGLLPSNPCAGIRAGSKGHAEMRVLTRAEYDAIYAAMPGHYRLLLETLVSTGMRWGEAIAVKADAVIQIGKKWYVRVRRTYAEIRGVLHLRDFGKTPNAVRNVSIPEHLARRLLAACAASGDGFAFHAVRGGGLLRNTFWRVFKQALRDAGVQGVRVHDLRHTHATWLLADGVPLLDVRDRMGHGNISTTSLYLHLLPTGDDPALGAVERFGMAA